MHQHHPDDTEPPTHTTTGLLLAIFVSVVLTAIVSGLVGQPAKKQRTMASFLTKVTYFLYGSSDEEATKLETSSFATSKSSAAATATRRAPVVVGACRPRSVTLRYDDQTTCARRGGAVFCLMNFINQLLEQNSKKGCRRRLRNKAEINISQSQGGVHQGYIKVREAH